VWNLADVIEALSVTEYGLALCAVSCTSCGQLCLKMASRTGLFPTASRQRWVKYAWLMVGYGALLLAVGISAYALRFLEVNVLVSLTALAYPLVVSLSRVFFDERLTRNQWSGLMLVCSGVALYNLA
jgi:drug/metabolite transporter (DMT)-like permease